MILGRLHPLHVKCTCMLWAGLGGNPKKGLSSAKHSSAKLIKAFHESISKSLFGKRIEAFFRSLSSSDIHRNDQILD